MLWLSHAMSAVNASAIAAAGYQHRSRPQRAKHSRCPDRTCKLVPNSHPSGVGAALVRQVCRYRVQTQCLAPIHSSVSGSSCSSEEIQLVKGSGFSRTCRRLPANLAELLMTACYRFVEITACLSLMTQTFPAEAGEIIQGMPRVSDGDTLQVDPSTCCALLQAAKHTLHGNTKVPVSIGSCLSRHADQRPEDQTVRI